MQKNKLKNQAGFTLFEIIIYVAIMAMIVTSFVTFSISISNVKVKVFVVQEVNSNIRNALDLIGQKIRVASAVTAPLSGANGSTLSLNFLSPDPSLTFSLNNGVLYLTPASSSAVAITNADVNITNLKFYNLAANGRNDSIEIFITAEYRNKSSREYTYSNSIETTVNIRN